MFHLVAWTESHDNVANQDLSPVTDGIMTIQNSHFLLQFDYDILWAAVMNTTIQRCRINTPSLRQITLPFITPVIAAAIPGNSRNVADYRFNPFRVRALEELVMEATQSNAGGARTTVVAALMRGARQQIPGSDIYTMRGTSSTAATANAWSNVAMTWADTLPAGTYLAVGLRHQSTNGQAARLIFEDQVVRPGTLSMNALTDQVHEIFVKGGCGPYGQFNANRMPNVEVLCNGADNSHEVYLDFMRIR